MRWGLLSLIHAHTHTPGRRRRSGSPFDQQKITTNLCKNFIYHPIGIHIHIVTTSIEKAFTVKKCHDTQCIHTYIDVFLYSAAGIIFIVVIIFYYLLLFIINTIAIVIIINILLFIIIVVVIISFIIIIIIIIIINIIIIIIMYNLI